jgi:hypothetical protein
VTLLSFLLQSHATRQFLIDIITSLSPPQWTSEVSKHRRESHKFWSISMKYIIQLSESLESCEFGTIHLLYLRPQNSRNWRTERGEPQLPKYISGMTKRKEWERGAIFRGDETSLRQLAAPFEGLLNFYALCQTSVYNETFRAVWGHVYYARSVRMFLTSRPVVLHGVCTDTCYLLITVEWRQPNFSL